jgi:hypothetical protein
MPPDRSSDGNLFKRAEANRTWSWPAAALPADHRPPGGLARAGQPQLYYGVVNPAGSRLAHLASLRRRELSGARRLSAPCNIFRLVFGSAGVLLRISTTRATPHTPHALARQGELLDIARTEFIGRI